MSDSPAPTVKREKSRIVCTLTFADAEVAAAEQKALSRLSADVNMKGFRPGKAPVEAVRERIKPEALFEETVHTLIQDKVPALIKEEQLKPIISPRIEIASRTPLTVTVTVVERPEVTVKGIDKMKIESKEIKVDEKDVKKVINSVLIDARTTKEVDRAANSGDQITIDFSGADSEGKAVPGFAGNAYAVVIGEAHLLPGFEDQLIGLKKGDDKKFSLPLPEGHPAENLKGKTLTFSVKTTKIEEVSLPELTDALVKEKLGMDSAAAFKKRVEDSLSEQEKNSERLRRERLLLDEIRNRTQVELAPELIDEELRSILHELEEDLKRQSKTFADWMKEQGKDQKEVEKDLRNRAQDRLKLRLGMSSIIEEKKIAVTPEEMKTALSEMLARVPKEQFADAEKAYAQGTEGYGALEWQKKVEKTMDLLLGQ
ncbi:trigger factor [Candidatus Peregrinibacteria bacterium]|nr:trigger factor [Candidatus Peregrinibacteria bacterium]